MTRDQITRLPSIILYYIYHHIYERTLETEKNQFIYFNGVDIFKTQLQLLYYHNTVPNIMK